MTYLLSDPAQTCKNCRHEKVARCRHELTLRDKHGQTARNRYEKTPGNRYEPAAMDRREKAARDRNKQIARDETITSYMHRRCIQILQVSKSRQVYRLEGNTTKRAARNRQEKC